MVWVYFLKHKSDIVGAFKTWKAMVENETVLKVKTLQLDNGGAYVNADFQRYCDENNIKIRRKMLGNSQQNGVTERMNRTLNKWVRSKSLRGCCRCSRLRRLIL